MIGSLTALVLFVVLVSFGLAVQLCFERSRIISLEKIFRAPAFGISVIMLPVLFLSRSGLTISSYFGASILVLGALAFVLIVRRKKTLNRTAVALPFAISICAILYAGFPLFHYDLNWVAFSNGDAIFYQDTATRLTEGGFFKIPTWQSIVTDVDPSQLLFFAQPLHGGDRPIFEMMLAVVSSFLHLSTTQVYMPVMVALFATQVFSTCALAASATRSGPWRPRRILTIALVGIFATLFALNALGFALELGPQVIGLSLLCCILSYRRIDLFPKNLTRRGLRLGRLTLLFATLCASYPEMLPFLFAGLGLTALIRVRSLLNARVVLALFGDVAFCVLVFAVVLNWHLLALVIPVQGMLHGGTSASNVANPVFPAFLIPTGIGALWGIVSTATTGATTFDEFAVILGAITTIFVATAAIVNINRAGTIPATTVAVLAVAALMFRGRVDFGLYKLAMFAQPFLVVSLILGITIFSRRTTRLCLMAGAMVILLLSGHTSFYYLLRSQDSDSNRDGNFVIARNATADRLVSHLLALQHETSQKTVVTDMTNAVDIAYLRMFARARYVVAPANTAGVAIIVPFPKIPFFRNLMERAESLANIRNGYYRIVKFLLPNEPGSSINLQQDLRVPDYGTASDEITLLAGKETSIFNLCQIGNKGASFGQFVEVDKSNNVLLPVAGEPVGLSKRYVDALPAFVSKDGFYGGNITPTPNLLLFEVLRPSRSIRVLLDFTTSLNIGGFKKIPPIAVIGKQIVYFSTAGEGRARLISPPVEPEIINHHAYILVRFEGPLFRFLQKRHGAAALFGTKISVDPRQLVGFLREVSAISASEEPTVCARTDPAPEPILRGVDYYSGFSEDGWLADESTFFLPKKRKTVIFEIAGMAPWINGGENTLSIITGAKRLEIQLGPGSFDSGPLTLDTDGSDRVSLQFSKFISQKDEDPRNLSFLASKIIVK